MMENQRLETGVKAEYDTAKTIIMHTPGEEIFMGTLQGMAALYDKDPIDSILIAKQHEKYINTLKQNNINVITVKETLLSGTLDKNNNKILGNDLDNLIKFAESCVQIVYPIELSLERLQDMKLYKARSMRAAHPTDLVRMILQRPSAYIHKCSENTEFIAESYKLHPLMNMHFLRDQQITTDKGIVIGKMNSVQRRLETDVTKYIFNKLELPIVGEITGSGRLEGGDFIPCGDYAFIGQGHRTNAEGIKQLLESNALGYKEIAVVKDSFMQQDEMHLDTYFNIAGPNKAVILEDRIDHYAKNNFVKTDPRKKTTVDIYQFVGDGYKKKKIMSFQKYLASKGFSVKDDSLIPLTKKEQLNYGCNFLTIAANKVIAVDIVDDDDRYGVDYINKMRKSGIDVIPIPFNEFVKTYGAPHCATQVIYRSK